MQISVNADHYISEVMPGDKPFLLKHLNETDVFHRQLLAMPYPYTEADAEAWINRATSESAEQNDLRLAIRDRDGSLIGGCGLRDLERGHRAEIGYWLAMPYWGKGITTAVVRSLCDFAFAEFDLVRIMAHLYARNEASARVLEKAGFQQEGYLRKHYRKHGEFLDAKVYARIR